MQFISINYPVFSLTIGALFLFGLVYAYIVRRLARAGVQGQTAYTVVVGVGITVLAAGWLIGWLNVILLLACFAASGLPMVIEYVNRTHHEQKRDRQDARSIAKDLLG
jgi:hypothetical protein